MFNHIKNFDTDLQYNKFILSQDYKEPHASLKPDNRGWVYLL